MARQSNAGSPKPPGMDIDTPDGSVCDDYTSAETQYEYPWTMENKQAIDDYFDWLNYQWQRVETLLYRGPTGEPWPKKPKVDVKKLDSRGAGRQQKGLAGQKLHEYLIANCVDAGEVALPQDPRGGFSSLEEMERHLKVGWERIKTHNRTALVWYIEYGQILKNAFTLHELEKDTGRRDSTWDEWLLNNVGISSPQGRKIRTVASLLAPYPGFKKLGLSFSEVYSRRKQIEVMLSANRAWADYWRRV